MPEVPRFPEKRIGEYRYAEFVNGTKPPVKLEGTITVERDTLILDHRGAACQYDLNSAGTRFIGYRCGEVGFSFERRDPISSNRYSLTATISTRVPKCVRFERNTKGQTICAETRVETEEHTSHRSGSLRPVAVK